MIKAIIFDLFGTLTCGGCDPEKEIIRVFALREDYNFVEKVVSGAKFGGMDAYLSNIINQLNLPDNPETRKALEDIFEQDVTKEKINPEMVALVKALKSKDLKLGLLSDMPNPIYDLVGKANLCALFDEILYSYSTGLSKPDLRFFGMMVSKLGVKNEEIIMVGDSLRRDISPARELGMKPILFQSADQLRKELASFSISVD
ncbi:MAG: HAD-IA family hydrolase [Candidatus Aenigmarchaeota archaeon]|nr:HAD-IA family hydrolase [Candidatus Aenigmarchaeota archaeon]